MVASLLRKLAEKLRGIGNSGEEQKLTGMSNPGGSAGKSIPNPTGVRTISKDTRRKP